ncbi:hypothetical protein N7492_009213 [Penicillium capsulatum]|uniref:Uncharacterized protein n=1 Tax=Penicillium capsulatum TaxID=69766 RepID=A0A9W9HU76_9EURO|nr:hypothetical protein N7492_009213 [Penicillium capsulatum]KAJ6106609.1 hypothetical protein N7512_010126 [Penicillium capsulatum]
MTDIGPPNVALCLTLQPSNLSDTKPPGSGHTIARWPRAAVKPNGHAATLHVGSEREGDAAVKGKKKRSLGQ